MSHAHAKALELIQREIQRMPSSHFPRPDESYATGMIEMAYACDLIADDQYRAFSAQIHELADQRWQEIRGVAA